MPEPVGGGPEGAACLLQALDHGACKSGVGDWLVCCHIKEPGIWLTVQTQGLLYLTKLPDVAYELSREGHGQFPRPSQSCDRRSESSRGKVNICN